VHAPYTGASRPSAALYRAADGAAASGAPAGAGAAWLSLPAPPASVAEGRRLVAAIDGLPARPVENTQLVVSELLTNALEHSGLRPCEAVALRVSRQGTRLRIDVDDGGEFCGSSEQPPRSHGRHRGRGLRIVAGLSVHWQAASGIVSAWIAI
jgi:anti-sigma regulatory factor (Ser/Thr protein kinase)